MRKNNLWRHLLIVPFILSLAACGSETPPLPQETAAPTSDSAAVDAAGEPNETWETAAEVAPGAHSGALDGDDQDWYAVQVPDGDILRVSLTPGQGANDLLLTLRSPERDEIWRREGLDAGAAASVTQVMGRASGGLYYLVVGPGEGTYTFDFSLRSQDDAGSGEDAADQASGARPTGPGQYEGQLADFDQKDYYAVDVPNGAVWDTAFTAGDRAHGMMVALRSPERDEIWRKEGLEPREEASITKILGSASGGRYYLVVGFGDGEYNFELALRSQDDAGSGGDAGGEAGGAVQLEPGGTYTGLLGDSDQEDWYTLSAAAAQTLVFTPDEAAQGMTVVLRGPDREEIWRKEGLAAGEPRSFPLEEADEDLYYVQVAHGDGPYAVAVE